MKQLSRMAGVLAFAFWVMMTLGGLPNALAATGDDAGDDDIIIIEEEGADDIGELSNQFDLLADEITEIRDTFGSFRKNVNVTGYGEVHINAPTDGGNTVFDAHRFVIGINARFTDWIFLNVEVDYEHGAQQLEFEMGYLDFLINPLFNLRVGVVLIPVGFLNEYHEPVFFWTVERPLLQSQIIPTSWQGTGGGAFGTVNALGGINYRLYVVNSLQSVRPNGFGSGSGVGNGGNSGRFRSSSGIRSGRLQPNNAIGEDIAVTGRLEFTGLFPGLQVGLSFWTGDTTHEIIQANGRTTLLEADVKFRIQWFEMNATIANIHVNDAEVINAFMTTQVAAGGNQNVASNMLGYNIQVGVHVPQLLNMGTTQDFVVHFMYEFVDTQDSAAPGFANLAQFERDVYTAGFAWFATPNVALKADFTHVTTGVGTSTSTANFGMAYMFF